MIRSMNRAVTAGLAALFLCIAGCSGEKPADSAPQNNPEALKQSADQQRQMYERMRHNK